jgi:hypothetical protein
MRCGEIHMELRLQVAKKLNWWLRYYKIASLDALRLHPYAEFVGHLTEMSFPVCAVIHQSLSPSGFDGSSTPQK